MAEFPVKISNAGIDASGSITAGGTAQTLTTAPAHGFFVFNPDPSNELWIRVGGTASANGQGSWCIPPLSMYETPTGYTPEGSISIVGAVTGQVFTAKKW